MKNNKKNGWRFCKVCGCKMKKNGKDRNGVQRWRCPNCDKTVQLGTKAKKSNKVLNDLKLYFEYSTNKLPMSQYGVHRSTVFRHIKNSRNKSIEIPVDKDYHRFIFLDAKWTSNVCTLIARDKFYVFKWQHVEKENAESWFNFINDIQTPEVVICDCQKGLLKAIRACWPESKIQYCLFHRLQSIDHKLTKNPVLQQGKELKQIRNLFVSVQTFEDKAKFIDTINDWTRNNIEFIKERTICLNGKRKWFYTRKNIRAVWKILLSSANSEYAFQYLDTPGCPRTNNYLEAGINSQIEKRLEMLIKGRHLRIELTCLKPIFSREVNIETKLISLLTKKAAKSNTN